MTVKKGNVLFNDVLNTFYLRLYGVGYQLRWFLVIYIYIYIFFFVLVFVLVLVQFVFCWLFILLLLKKKYFAYCN